MSRILRLLVVLALAAATVGLTAAPSQGARLIVTRFDDPAPGPCRPNNCSLREAVIEANGTAGRDTIVLGRGTYTLEIMGAGEDAAATGDLDITRDLTIIGEGRAKTTIDGNGGVTGDRVFHIDPVSPGTGPSVEMSDLTIRGGSPPNVSPKNGGGLLVQNIGSLTIRNVRVSGNESFDTAGGVHSDDNAVTIIADSVISGNDANNGGGIGNWDDSVMTITNTTVSGNAGFGGGIINENQAKLTIRGSAITGNDAGDLDEGGGIVTYNDTTLTIVNSTISGNRSGRDGGGLFVEDAPTVSLTNVTITKNTADSDGGGTAGDGGGIFVDPAFAGTFTLRNTILAGNTDGSAGSEAPDCSGSLPSQGFNLVQRLSGCTFMPKPSDLTGVNPRLGPLANNGGATRTHALRAGSPARDQIRAARCSKKDQRGAPRSGKCDMGAYEFVTCQGVLVNRVGTNGRDVLRGTPGGDGILGLGGADSIRAGKGPDSVCAGGGNDTVLGGAGADKLAGQGGNDTLKGGADDDLLKGAAGTDACIGGAGSDRFTGCETVLP